MLPVQITIRDLPESPTLDNHIRKKVEKLGQFYNRINSCRVCIGAHQKHKNQGKLYDVRIDLTVPGKELVVNRKRDEDIYIAIREAFNAIARQLEEHSRKRHGRVKSHNGVIHGHIVRIIPEEGFGFIEGIDGNEYYFSLTNVGYPSFEQLMIGDGVEFMPEILNDGLQAHHVIREKNHHLA